MITPLQLKDYTIDHVSFEVNPVYRTDRERVTSIRSSPPRERFQLSYELFRDKETGNQSGIRLIAELQPEDPDEDWRYKVSIGIFGEFAYIDEPQNRPETFDPDHFLLINGLSILYGLLRAKVTELTSGTPYGKLILSTVDFSAIVEKNTRPESQEALE